MPLVREKKHKQMKRILSHTGGIQSSSSRNQKIYIYTKMIIWCRFSRKVRAAVRRFAMTQTNISETQAHTIKTKRRNGKMVSCARVGNFLNNNNASVRQAVTISKWQHHNDDEDRLAALKRAHNKTSFRIGLFFFSLSSSLFTKYTEHARATSTNCRIRQEYVVLCAHINRNREEKKCGQTY